MKASNYKKASKLRRTLARRTLFFASSLAAWLLGVGGCSTTELTPPDAPVATLPPYARVSHPEGYTVSDVRTIFLDPTAPKIETLKSCDVDFFKLKSLTQSKDEFKEGVKELVRQDPLQAHWCYYGKVLMLENEMSSEDFIDVKQKSALDAYSYFVPIARAFESEFHDSRYLRFAVQHYRRISEWIFYRRLDLTPQITSELVDAANPFDYWRAPAASGNAVLTKYGLTKTPVAPVPQVPPTAPVAVTAPEPVASAAPHVPATPVAKATTLPAIDPLSEAEDMPPPTAGAQRDPATDSQ